MRKEILDANIERLQNRNPKDICSLLEKLWQRGLSQDLETIEKIRSSTMSPTPSFLQAPEGVRLFCTLPNAAAKEVANLLEGTYWNEGVSIEQMIRAHIQSSAWVGARDTKGSLIASARAISDYSKRAWIYDVIVEPIWRRHKLGSALMRLLLSHPALRNVAKICLGTRDAQDFYRAFGFQEMSKFRTTYLTEDMMLQREIHLS